MLKSMKIKIITPVVAILAFLFVVTIIGVSVATGNLADTLSEERILGASQSARIYLDNLKARTQAASASMAISPALIELLQVGSGQELYLFLSERADALKIDGFIVTDAFGYVVMRTHTPGFYGDLADHLPSIAKAMRGETITAYSLSPMHPMTMTTASPVYDEQGSLIATLSSFFILSSDDFVDRFGATFNAQVSVFSDYIVAASTVLNVDGSRTTGMPVASLLVADAVIGRGETFRTIITLYEVEHHAYYFPLHNAAQEIIGMFFVGFSNEYTQLATVSLQNWMLFFGWMGLVVSTIIMLFFLAAFLKPLASLTKSVSTIRDAGREGADIYGITRTDEVGVLSRTIQNMLQEIGKAQSQEKRTSELNQVILESAPFVIGLWSGNSPIYGNAFTKELFGVNDPSEVTSNLYDFSPELQPCGTPTPQLAEHYAIKAYTEGYVRFEWMHKDPKGGPMPVDVVYKCFTHDDEKMLVSYTMDLREARTAQEEAKYRENLLNAVNKAAEVLLTADEEDILDALMAGMEIVGRSVDADRVQIWRNEMIDDKLHFVMRYEWLSEVGKEKTEVPIGLKFPYSDLPEWLEMFSKGHAINSPISKLPPRDAQFLGYYEMMSIVCLPLFMNGEFIGFFSVDDCRNEKTYTNDEMDMFASTGLMFTSVFNRSLQKELAYTDELTGAYNRRHFTETAQMALHKCNQEFRDFSVIMIDIDHFKEVNDTHGHAIGDEVLKIFTSRIRHVLKQDTPLARYGGEEFAIKLEGVSLENAVRTAHRLSRAIQDTPFIVGPLKINITASFGVASKTDTCTTLPEIMNDADKALYQAKESGRNNVVGYSA
ncbi:MAG: diguanylate cyclase [Defluviitaleaceae bacterium]|nr:diguanylate cyclase [Defluviitaleaceae bacterium]